MCFYLGLYILTSPVPRRFLAHFWTSWMRAGNTGIAHVELTHTICRIKIRDLYLSAYDLDNLANRIRQYKSQRFARQQFENLILIYSIVMVFQWWFCGYGHCNFSYLQSTITQIKSQKGFVLQFEINFKALSHNLIQQICTPIISSCEIAQCIFYLVRQPMEFTTSSQTRALKYIQFIVICRVCPPNVVEGVGHWSWN